MKVQEQLFETFTVEVKDGLVVDGEQGFVLEGFYRDKPYRIQRLPHQSNSLHIEYDYCYLRPEDCVDISTESDSFYCYPVKQNVVTKMAFATEELYRLSQEKGKKKQAKAEKVNTEE